MGNAFGKPIVLTATVWTEITAASLQIVAGPDFLKPWINMVFNVKPDSVLWMSYSENGEGKFPIQSGGIWADPIAGQIPGSPQSFWLMAETTTTVYLHMTLGA